MLSEVHCPKSMGQWAIVSKNNWTSDYAWTSDFGLPPDPTKSVIRNPKFNAVDTPCFVVILEYQSGHDSNMFILVFIFHYHFLRWVKTLKNEKNTWKADLHSTIPIKCIKNRIEIRHNNSTIINNLKYLSWFTTFLRFSSSPKNRVCIRKTIIRKL